MTSKLISNPRLSGNVGAAIDPYFAVETYPYDIQYQFGNDHSLNSNPTRITFNQSVCNFLISVKILNDFPDMHVLKEGSNLPISLQYIKAVFFDEFGNKLGFHTLYDTVRGLNIGAYYKVNNQIDPVQVAKDMYGVNSPIKSVLLYSPSKYEVAYVYEVSEVCPATSVVNTSIEDRTFGVPQPIDIPVVNESKILFPPVMDTSNSPPTTEQAGPPPIYYQQPIPEYRTNYSYSIPMIVRVSKVTIPVLQTLIDQAIADIHNAYETFVDDERFCKLLLNFGSDYQKVIVNQKLSANDPNELLIKLLNPLESFVNEGQPVFISREVAQTTIDKVRIELPPLLNTNPYLRPRLTYDRYH